MELEYDRMDAYWRSITIIEAQQTLIALKICDFPHMKKSDRQKWHRQLHKQAYPATWSPRNAMTNEDLARAIGIVKNG
jgi:hypothetical protein